MPSTFLTSSLLLILAAHALPSVAEDINARQGVLSLKAYAEYKAGNFDEARKIWLKLADAGNTTAMNNLANMFDQGQGSPKNIAQSITWLRQGAERGDPVSQLNLGLAYETGRGVQRDNHQAAKWFRAAALQDDMDAQFNLGVMLLTAYGKGLDMATRAEKDEAESWLKKAAKQYHPEAREFLKLVKH